jgi:hypothetical protein
VSRPRLFAVKSCAVRTDIPARHINPATFGGSTELGTAPLLGYRKSLGHYSGVGGG